MSHEILLSLYDRLIQLVEKLPGGIQKPILRELMPIRETFLTQRPPRFLLVGGSMHSVPELFHQLAGVSVETGGSEEGWRKYRVASPTGSGDILILDGREDVPAPIVESALAACEPDVVIYLRDPEETSPVLEEAAKRVSTIAGEIPLLGMAFGGESGTSRLAALLRTNRQLALRSNKVCAVEDGPQAVEELCSLLPNPAKLEFARLMGARKAQAEIATSLLKSFTTVCGVIGLQPIPLADMPVLTSLQTLMVGMIINVSGKSVSPRLIAEFLGALGLNIGAGILFREGARAIIKIVPLWGQAVSGFVAGAGTYAIGRAAIAYFIEETPIQETKKLFQHLLPGWDAFKRRGLPLLKRKKPPTLPED